MKLINKYFLLFIVFITFFILIEVVLKQQVEKYAIYENNEKLNNILVNQKALHTYVEDMQKPVIYRLKEEGKLYKDFFNPNILSFTYIARNIHELENNILKESNKTQKYYKLASINSRNDLNKANVFEQELIKKFNTTNQQEYKEVIETDGKKFLYYAKPVGVNKESCMKCHSTPDIAPKELITQYGDSKGFYEHVGDVRAIISIKIPLENELYIAQEYYKIITLLIAISLLIIYTIIVYLMKKLDSKQKKLEELVSIDDLTKCYNRRSFEIDFKNEIEEAKRNNTQFSLISFDIDHFKNINDTYGHQFGDTVLINICALINLKNRTYDKIYRVGGEEFMIFLPNTTLKSAIQIAERIRVDVQENKINDTEVTISLGVCQYTKEDTMKTLYKKVDDTLYNAKNNGRNRVESCEQ